VTGRNILQTAGCLLVYLPI